MLHKTNEYGKPCICLQQKACIFFFRATAVGNGGLVSTYHRVTKDAIYYIRIQRLHNVRTNAARKQRAHLGDFRISRLGTYPTFWRCSRLARVKGALFFSSFAVLMQYGALKHVPRLLNNFKWDDSGESQAILAKQLAPSIFLTFFVRPRQTLRVLL